MSIKYLAKKAQSRFKSLGTYLQDNESFVCIYTNFIPAYLATLGAFLMAGSTKAVPYNCVKCFEPDYPWLVLTNEAAFRTGAQMVFWGLILLVLNSFFEQWIKKHITFITFIVQVLVALVVGIIVFFYVRST